MASLEEAPDGAQTIAPQPTEDRAPRVLVVAGSQRRHNSCPGLDSKARALMTRMAARLPTAWQIDTEDLMWTWTFTAAWPGPIASSPR